MEQMPIILAACGGFLVGLIIGLIIRSKKADQSDGSTESTRTRGAAGTVAKNIYVGNLSPNVSEKDLRETFEVFGGVVTATIIKDKARGGHKRFAFVEMSDAIEAESAIKSLDGRDLKGRTLKVKEAHNRGTGGRGGRSRSFPHRNKRRPEKKSFSA